MPHTNNKTEGVFSDLKKNLGLWGKLRTEGFGQIVCLLDGDCRRGSALVVNNNVGAAEAVVLAELQRHPRKGGGAAYPVTRHHAAHLCLG